MPIDASIPLQARQVQLQDPTEVMGKVMSLRTLTGQQQLQQYQLAQAQRQDQQQQTLADLYKGNINPDGTVNRQAVLSGAANAGIGQVIPGLQKQFADADKATADVGKTKAQANQIDLDMAVKRAQASAGALQSLVANPNVTHQDVINTMVSLVHQGLVTPEQGQQAIADLPGQQEQLRPYLMQKGMQVMDAAERMKLLLPKTSTIDNGAQILPTNTDPLTGKVTVGQPLAQKQVSPDTMANNATSRANNAANIQKDLQVAGIAPGGGLDPNGEAMAQAIAKGQVAPLSGFSLARPRGQNIMARVMEINPQYDETTYAAKNAAAKAFTTGPQGNAMRSFAVAGQHLDQLGQLVDAMDNGNIPLMNKLANTYSQQTGSTPVTNFDAAKDIVSKEVVKAIVAGGGGVSEREELANAMNNAKSPAQLKGVISQYRNLMAAQHDALMQQRQAAGLSDSTLPNYTPGTQQNGGPNQSGGINFQLPPDIQSILDKHGAK